jgi:hypothetical protein
MNWIPFSRRTAPAPAGLREDIPPEVRSRLLHTVIDDANQWMGMEDINSLLTRVGTSLVKQYGSLEANVRGICSEREHPAIIHFLNCNDRRALDFIEAVFLHVPFHRINELVQMFNQVFQQEGIAYEIQPYEETLEPAPPGMPPYIRGASLVNRRFPTIIPKTGEYAHREIVRPCLDILAKPVFKTAENEMRKAHEHYRNSHYEDVITLCGSAFESVLKIIIDQKGWQRREQDVGMRLLVICQSNGLISQDYVDVLSNTAKVRNATGSVHGRGAAPPGVERAHADHIIQITSANITLVARLANL